MNKPALCIIGRVVWLPSIKANHLNFVPVKILSRDFKKIYLIVQSPDGVLHISHDRDIIVFHLPRKGNRIIDYLFFIFAAITIGTKLNTRTKIDIFDASEAIAGGIAAVMLKLYTGAKVMLHLQGDLLNLPEDHLSKARVKQIRFIVKTVSRFADRIRCVSESVLKNAIEAGIPRGKLIYIPSRCDTSAFNPDAVQSAEDIKAKHRLAGKRVVLFIGTLSIHKGVTYLLKAFAKIAKSNAQAALVIVGSGMLEDELRAMAQALGLTDRVSFCGRIPYTDIPRYLSIADVFAFPSIDEGLPRAVMEAMSMRVPVVATRVGGIPELIIHGETGLLVSPGNPDELAEAISRLLQKKDTGEMTIKARNKIVSNYCFDNGLNKYRNVLYEIANMPHIPEFPS